MNAEEIVQRLKNLHVHQAYDNCYDECYVEVPKGEFGDFIHIKDIQKIIREFEEKE